MALNKLTCTDIIESNDASNWLKNSIRTALYGRDLVDMINDTEVLLAVLNNEFNGMTGGNMINKGDMNQC